MERRSVIALVVPVALLLLTAIPVAMGMVRAGEVALGTLPPDAAKYLATPSALFLHGAAGALFGVLGPLQFGRVLARRFGVLHRVLGRVFVACGVVLALSGLRLLWAFPGTSTPVLDIARIAAAVGLAAALWIAVRAARARDIARHSAWMIRAYAIGMGAATIALIMFPIFLITGEAPTGLVSDILFVGSWGVNLILAEVVLLRSQRRLSA